MKLALLADIHGNYMALEACLNYIEQNNFDGIIFLGDYITDCPYPQKTISLLKNAMKVHQCWFIRGNREEYMINHHKNSNDNWCYSSQTGSLLYTYENLSNDDITFFENMPIFNTINFKSCKHIVICHGSPTSIREMLLEGEENSNNCLETLEADYLFCGHTHDPFKYKYKGKILTNCGSVGLPTNNQINSQFTAIEFMSNKWKIDLILVPYNIDSLVNDFEESGIYDKGFWWSKSIVKTLQTGVNYSMLCIQKANELAGQRNERLSEKHWEMAAKELYL
ncbi:metallophosphoesterase [Paludicola sp. MB14-C6]|uniref:metallophosphoesterase family protein n=1 Tax=Paludihabitans sp. MB14-C6 TaxID=3070656 RepID=UPI0027DADBCD|nr:metallophosphoesterase [Paludicola sp. MB14-C6]WMJ23193.1 metallophosphoesterase [Paludicola sp. MB14-C6]